MFSPRVVRSAIQVYRLIYKCDMRYHWTGDPPKGPFLRAPDPLIQFFFSHSRFSQPVANERRPGCDVSVGMLCNAGPIFVHLLYPRHVSPISSSRRSSCACPFRLFLGFSLRCLDGILVHYPFHPTSNTFHQASETSCLAAAYRVDATPDL